MFKAVLLAATAQAVQLRKFDPLAASCYSPEDSGAAYRGLTDTTASGRKCTRWTEVDGGPSVSPDNGLGNHGYCRNPDKKHSKPYCYPMDTPGETEECNIDECPVDNRDVQQEAADVATYVLPRLRVRGAALWLHDHHRGHLRRRCPAAEVPPQ